MAKLGDMIGRGLLAARPAAGTEGRLYEATDAVPPTVYRDNGASWDTYATVGAATVAVSALTTADVTLTHVLAPDGAGGVTTRAEAGGGSGGTPATNAAALIYAYLSFR